MRVKVCGITRERDAIECSRPGVHALGFNFYRGSSRYIDPAAARRVAAAAPPFVLRVGVFVNEADVDLVQRIARRVGLHALQFHGDETPEYCRRFQPYTVIKAFRVGASFSSAVLESYDVDAFLLDGFHSDMYGGSGVTADWEAARQAAARFPVILSGGLSADNVRRAVERVRPLAVDVCSGVESAPGVKDTGRLTAFLRQLQVD